MIQLFSFNAFNSAKNFAFSVWLFVLVLYCGFPGATRAQTETEGGQSSAASLIPIEPMTQVNEAEHLGYFGDPYPIHLASPLEESLPQSFSGTTSELMTCKRPVEPGCFETSALKVVIPDDLRAAANDAGSEFFDQINRNIYQTENGHWQMAITLYLRPLSSSKTNLEGSWTVIAHAHPKARDSVRVPASWQVDTILVGSLSTPEKANYDGKYFEDGNKLYLIYSKRKGDTVHDGIVAQEMASPTERKPDDPVWLLSPSTVDDGFNSEYFHINWASGGSDADFKLIETGNITKIGGKYVMAYSAGDYQQLNYKTGVAYSDTLLPKPGEMYRRVLQKDASGVWGQPGHAEVRYLLQSQEEEWPNYVAAQVLAPGVPSIVRERSGKYFLYFDGYLPGNALPSKNAPKKSFDPTYRRPFYVPLSVNVPLRESVEAAPEEALMKWITVASPREN